MRGRSSVSTLIFPYQPSFSISFSKRLLALAAQKFVSDIAADAYQHARIRTNATGGRTRAQQSFGSLSARVCLLTCPFHLYSHHTGSDTNNFDHGRSHRSTCGIWHNLSQTRILRVTLCITSNVRLNRAILSAQPQP